jgi:hypothetical protein
VTTSRKHGVPSIAGWLEALVVPRRIARSPRTAAPIAALIAALFLASATLILPVGALEWIDVAMLHLVPSIDLFSLVSGSAPVETVVLTIGPRFFEQDFEGKTPISRAPFVKLLNCVVRTFGPQVLAIDYDLSPGSDELNRLHTNAAAAVWTETSGDPCDGGAPLHGVTGGQMLDAYLTSLGRPSAHRLTPVSVVLIRPLPVDDPKICKNRLAWEAQMRQQKVVFGNSDLVHHSLFGVVVKYERVPESFAQRVHCERPKPPGAHDGDPLHHGGCPGTPAETRTPSCMTIEQFRTRQVDPERLDRVNFLQASTQVHTYELAGFRSVRDFAEYHRRGVPVVFVGAAYDPSDRFTTPLGQKAGVVLHAYSAFSIGQPLKERHWPAFLIDVAIGTMVGWALSRTWGTHYAMAGRARRVVGAGTSLFVVGVAGLISVFLARFLMSHGMWMNPGPMLVAFFIDSWHTSASAHEHAHHRATGGSATAMVEITGDMAVSAAPGGRLYVPRLLIWLRTRRGKNIGEHANAPSASDRAVGWVACFVWLGVVGWAVVEMLLGSH